MRHPPLPPTLIPVMSTIIHPSSEPPRPPANRSSGNPAASTADSHPDTLLATAMEAARAAADIHREGLAQGERRRIASKSWRNDFVTDVDLAAQEAALAIIRNRHPQHAILAEEELVEGELVEGEDGTALPLATGTANAERRVGQREDFPAESGGSAAERDTAHAGDAAPPAPPLLWIVDPLDGTTNFMHGHPFHAASVAVRDSRGPLAATVHAQALDRVWTATRGGGAFENGQPVRVSSVRETSGFLVGTGFPFKTPHLMDDYLRQLGAVLRATSGVRRAGAAAIDLAYVANGVLDGFWEMRLAPWDFAAGELLVAEAGGAAERIEGGPLGIDAGSVVAANSAAALAELRRMLPVARVEVAAGSGCGRIM